MNSAERAYGHPNIWPIERDGMARLNRDMGKDKSERLAFFVITKEKLYSVQSVEKYDAGNPTPGNNFIPPKGFFVVGGLVDHKGKIVAGNVDGIVTK